MSFIQTHTYNPAMEKVVPKGALVFDWYDPLSVAKRLRDGHALTAQDVASQIEEQVKPPRIPEPGLWGVVATGYDDGSSVDYWTHGPGGWFNERGQIFEWADLVDPVPIRPGIEDES